MQHAKLRELKSKMWTSLTQLFGLSYSIIDYRHFMCRPLQVQVKLVLGTLARILNCAHWTTVRCALRLFTSLVNLILGLAQFFTGRALQTIWYPSGWGPYSKFKNSNPLHEITVTWTPIPWPFLRDSLVSPRPMALGSFLFYFIFNCRSPSRRSGAKSSSESSSDSPLRAALLPQARHREKRIHM